MNNNNLINIDDGFTIKKIDTTKPRIYVACLASYIDGELHGTWIDATQDKDKIYSEIHAMLAESDYEDADEFAIHDYDNFGDVEIHEYETIVNVSKLAKFIDKHGKLGAKVLEHYGDVDGAEEALMDRYHGAWESELTFSSDFFDDMYARDIPENVKCYIDYEQFSQALFINDFISFQADGKTHVFCRC